MTETSLGFDPGSLSSAMGDDGTTALFTEDQIKDLGKFKGDKGQITMARSYLDLQAKNSTSDEDVTKWKELRDNFKDNEARITDYESKLENSISTLKEDATDEDRTAHKLTMKKFLGTPEKIEGYDVLKNPENLTIDEESMKGFKEVAFENNWSVEAAQGVLDMHNALVIKAKEAFDDKQDEAKRISKKILTKEFGGNEAYIEKCEHVKRMLRERVNPDWRNTTEEMDEDWQEFQQEVYNAGIGNNHILMSALSEAVDKGVGRKEGQTHIEMHGSVPVEGQLTPKQEWEKENPGVAYP